MSAVFLLISLFVCLLIGVPVAVSLGLASITTMLLFADQSLLSLAQRFFHTMQVYPLLAVPFFVLAGTFMTTGGVAKRMIDFANALVGRFQGGLAMAAVLACAFFAAVSGSSPATVVAVGSVMVAGMVNSGYTKPFAAGVICNAGTLGILIPPSIVMVVYGAVTESSIGHLFMAGVVPGILLTLALMATISVIARRQGMPRQPSVSWRVTLRAGREAIWGLFLVVIIMGGIYLGIFTPTEAAAVAAVYAILISVFYLRTLDLKALIPVFVSSVVQSGIVLLLVGASVSFAWIITVSGLANTVADGMASVSDNILVLLFLLNIFLLLIGMFLDAGPAVLVLGPVLGPMFIGLGIDPLHFAVVMCVNVTVGLATPPMGLVLFVSAALSRERVETIALHMLPFLLVEILVIFLITYFPVLSLALPRWLGFA